MQMTNIKRRTKKIILGVLLIAIGVPVAFVVTILAWISISDKTNGTIVSSGKTRRYLLYVPKTYDPSKLTPLVISLHPAASWPAAEMNISRWNDLADEHGFIVVYPAGTGLPQIWHTRPSSLELDVKFISDLMDKLEAEYNIDPARIYINGLSQGGGMVFVLSCRLSRRVAAVGAVAAAEELPSSWCSDSTPVPMIAFHGTADGFVPYKGGKSRDPFNPITFPDVRDWAADWARRNQCTGDPVEVPLTANVSRLTYTNCAQNADVNLYTVEGGGHSWPGGKGLPEWFVGRTTQEINATSVMWEFYVQHPRRQK
jgi:polyhydroxybutyrate depolymerase